MMKEGKQCLGGRAGISISPDNECGSGVLEEEVRFSYQQIMKVDVSWSSMEDEVGSNQTMNPPGVGSQHCWRQHSGDLRAVHLNSCTVVQLYRRVPVHPFSNLRIYLLGIVMYIIQMYCYRTI